MQYEIKPTQNWESLRRYKKFTGVSSKQVFNCQILVKLINHFSGLGEHRSRRVHIGQARRA